MSAGEPLLDARGVALIRGGRLLFDAFDMCISPGDGIQLTGPNGSGKTSLLRLFAGLLQPSAGTVSSASIALADEHSALDRELPLGRALAFWGQDRLDVAITAFGLEPLSEVPVRLLSAGQIKRAALARTMATGTMLWLLDEPHNGLDREAVKLLDAAIAAQRGAGGAVIVATHLALAGEWRRVELGQ